MTRTARQEPREASRIREPKDIRAIIEASAKKPKPDFAALLFANLRRHDREF